jgi:hypothetical protein
MTVEDQRHLVMVDAPITGFSGETVYPQGEITFPVTICLLKENMDVKGLLKENLDVSGFCHTPKIL